MRPTTPAITTPFQTTGAAYYTTQAPTTRAPTFAPTTIAPTFAPTTRAPTFAPTTFAPTTFAPTTFAPTTFAPTTFAPTTRAPTFAPTTFAPTQAATSAPTYASTYAPTTQAATTSPLTNPLSLNVDTAEFVSDLKNQIFQQTGIPVTKQSLYLGSQLLTDSNTLNFYNITSNSNISIFVNP